MKEVQESTKGVLLLDSGDLLFKKFSSPIPENELNIANEKAHLIVKSFNLIGYNAVGIGDDDLSLGKEFLLKISKEANFPFLSSNLIDEDSGKDLFPPYILKEVNGLRIGIFSLLSPDSFRGQEDPRRRGVVFRSPVETAQDMVKELQPKTDLIILLSHLGYNKDVELAQMIKGIHFIVGGHTGINFYNPPLINNTIILQTALRGMYAGRLNLTFYNHEPGFYNTKVRQTLEQNLKRYSSRLSEGKAQEPEKAQLQKLKEGIEQTLKQLLGKNEFTNIISPLNEQMKSFPDIEKMIEAYRSGLSDPEKSQTPK